MLIEGECGLLAATKAAEKFGYSKQRYYQLLRAFLHEGDIGLQSKKRGPKTNYRRTAQVGREVIRYRFLNPEASAQVIAQKLRQTGFSISTRSVERVIGEYGLQKKNYTPIVRTLPTNNSRPNAPNSVRRLNRAIRTAWNWQSDNSWPIKSPEPWWVSGCFFPNICGWAPGIYCAAGRANLPSESSLVWLCNWSKKQPCVLPARVNCAV